ncbi:MAG: hypothetical protein DRP38_06645 [Thermotogae bacterium]|nr:MAG: hypothetical protein DRP38_06645 [Thermotogota bacterium]
MNRVYISSIFAAAGLLVLLILSDIIEPPEIGLNEISEYEGEKVIVRGVVTEIYLTSGGNTVLLLSDGVNEIKVFAFGKRELFMGDRIAVRGIVQRYEDSYEILADHIYVLERRCTEVKLWQLAENPLEYLNDCINLSCYTVRIDGYNIVVKEDNYTLMVIYPLISTENLNEGDRIRVTGRFLYNPEKFSFYILATEVKRI